MNFISEKRQKHYLCQPKIKNVILLVFYLLLPFQAFASEHIYMTVGEIRTLYYPYEITSKTLAGKPAPVSYGPNCVSVQSYTYSSVTLKALSATGQSPIIVQVTYYYYEQHGNATYQRKGVYDYYVHVSAAEPTSISVSPSSLTLNPDQMATIYANVNPSGSNTTITWDSEDYTIALAMGGAR